MFDTADILPKARKIDLVVKDLGEEILIYDVNSSKAHSLNETISFIWSKCDGKTTFKTVEKELTKKLDTLIERDFIELALKELKEANLLEDETPEYLCQVF